MMRDIYRSENGRRQVLAAYGEILRHWPQSAAHVTVPTRFGETFVTQSGNAAGSPVLLLHGSSTNSAMWMGDAAVLGRAHRLFAVDIIGEPGKSAPARPPMKDGNYAHWIADVMDGLGLQRAALVGNSLGGWMALDFATAHPRRVSALVLLASGGLCSVRPSFVLKAVGLGSLGKRGAARLARLLFGSAEISDQALAFGELLRKHYIPRPFESQPFSREALARLDMPVLYLGGDSDAIFNTGRCAARLKSAAPHANAQVLRGTHHTLVGLGSQIAQFLQQNEEAT